MDNKKIENELLKIQKEIEELPNGYISKKNINGKTKYYLQWSEEGKKKSKYVDDSLVDDLKIKIERRRELKTKEKELKLMLPKKKIENIKKIKSTFKTNILRGDDLKKYVSVIKNYKKRNIFKDISNYIYGDVIDRVFILYGLRRTGKTT